LSFSGGDNIFYRSGTVAGLRVDAAIFPFALSSRFAADHPVIASFGLIGQFEHFFSFGYPIDGGGTVNGSGQRYEIVAAGRIPLGHRAVGGYLQVETGYQRLVFGHDNEMLAGVPNVAYDTIDLGLQWDRSLGVKWLHLAVRFAYLAPVGAGDIAAANQFGRASAWGIDADAGLTFIPIKWLWFRLEGRFSAIGMKFNGTGALVANSSTDEYPGGALQAGFAL
ncbi:MAG: hypothetical protein JO255_19555, partial [Alphaproteobacteria bacterium]|nr:hypothetical protein [Alphaproteobacteria bacterium]